MGVAAPTERTNNTILSQRKVHAVFALITKTFMKVKVHDQKVVASNPQTNTVNLALTGLAMLPFRNVVFLPSCQVWLLPARFHQAVSYYFIAFDTSPFDTATPNL